MSDGSGDEDTPVSESSGEAPAPPPDRAQCTPCGGTGKLQSTLGGEAHEVKCPWCGGTGAFVPGRDAQAEGPAE